MATHNKRYMKTIIDPYKNPLPLSKEELSRLYYQEKLSLDKIGEKIGSSRVRLARWMEYWGMSRRTSAESTAIARQADLNKRGPNWKGGRWKGGGQWFIYAPTHPRRRPHNLCVPEHYVIAEGRIGRFIDQGESVHHLDGNHENNDPLNLCVMLEGEHRSLHTILGSFGAPLLARDTEGELLNFVKDSDQREFLRIVYIERRPCVTGMFKRKKQRKWAQK